MASYVIATVLFMVLAVASAAEDKYTTKYDSVDLEDILHNDRLFSKYAQCVLDDGEEKCTADGKELKAAIPEALLNECGKCNEKQRAGAEKVIKFLIANKKDIWEKLTAKYDPQGEYYKRYEHYLKE